MSYRIFFVNELQAVFSGIPQLLGEVVLYGEAICEQYFHQSDFISLKCLIMY